MCCWFELVDVEECRVVFNGVVIVVCGLFFVLFFLFNYCCCFFVIGGVIWGVLLSVGVESLLIGLGL